MLLDVSHDLIQIELYFWNKAFVLRYSLKGYSYGAEITPTICVMLRDAHHVVKTSHLCAEPC